jgi:hypothetical protein
MKLMKMLLFNINLSIYGSFVLQNFEQWEFDTFFSSLLDPWGSGLE